MGDWRVDPAAGQISKGDEIVRVEARTMRLLVCLAERAGEVVSIDDLLEQAWPGVIVTPDSVYQGIAALRRYLADDPKEPAYIATVPRLGYRMVARVAPWTDAAPAEPVPAPEATNAGPDDERRNAGARPLYAAWSVVAALAAAIVLLLAYSGFGNRGSATRHAPPPPSSVAVLPFLDLTTQEMNEEYFADGLTEELIGALSGGGLRVPSPTSSFYYKSKQLPVAEVARQLGVVYVVDGSVRKSDNLYRVALRLVRAETGYVVFAASYDRPLGDLLAVQRSIAAEAAVAVRHAIEGPGAR
jgi:TolB-like protein/DNA-binding winged helix-turn-helix (wHTH) protein